MEGLLLGIQPACEQTLALVGELLLSRPPHSHLQQHHSDGVEEKKEPTEEDSSPYVQWWDSNYCLVPDPDQDGNPLTIVVGAVTTPTTTSQSENVSHSSADDVSKWVYEALRQCYQAETDGEEESPLTVEIWASAPAPIPLPPPRAGGGYHDEMFSLSRRNHQPGASSSMQEWGLALEEQVLDEPVLAKLRCMVDSAIHETEASIRTHRPDIRIGKDNFCFSEIASRNLERFDLRLDPLLMEPYVDHILENDNIRNMLEENLGVGEFDCDASVVYSKKGACVQNMHADGKHHPGSSDAGFHKDGWRTQLSKPYAICLFIPLIDLNHEVGFTQFWPGSHRNRGLIGFGSVAELTHSTWDGICKAGGAVCYDYRLIHRGMPNNSKVVRPVVQLIFKKKWYVERDNYGTESIGVGE